MDDWPEIQLARLGQVFQALKRTLRTGWLMRGIAPGEAENVAAHTAGVGLVALALAEQIVEPVDRGRLLAICLLHDLAEAAVSDMPWPAVRYLPAGAKQMAEQQALTDLLAGLPFADDWLALWLEFEEGTTAEGRLARDADRLDMLLQVAAYEAAGRRGLEEFWQPADQPWHYPESAALFQQLLVERELSDD